MADDAAAREYDRQWRRAQDDPDGFWLDAAGAIDWSRPPASGWSEAANGWFADGELNTCHNALDRHVGAGRGDDPALICESGMTGESRIYSFGELQDAVARTAGLLAGLGIVKGDRIVIYMPMIAQTVIAMLACARIGAVHSVVFGGFAAPELAKRIDDARPRLVLTASCGLEPGRVLAYKPLVDAALAMAAHRVDHVLLWQRPELSAELNAPVDLDWRVLLADALPAPCVAVAATDPLYILYTSGTTGTPKGVVRDNGGHAVALAWSMANIYGMQPGETFWAASDVGWVVGHSYIVYGPLIAGCATVLYEGKPVGTPDAGAFWRIIDRHEVRVFFTAPSAIRAVRKADPDAGFLKAIGKGRLRAMFLAGERADPDTLDWAERQLDLPVIDHWWQTELGWPALASCLGLGDRRHRPGSAGVPVPGYRFSILDDGGNAVADGDTGHVTIAVPLPPGAFGRLWDNVAGYAKSFARFPGHYETGDAGFRDADGFIHIMSRTDDLINVAGHRLSTGQMEEILARHPAVSESAVIGASDPVKGMIPMGFVVLAGEEASADSSALGAELVALVRAELGPVAAFRSIHFVPALPKTRSGKVLRAAIRAIADGEQIDTPPTIENPDSLAAIGSAVGVMESASR
ncbi:MAG: AMP-binding protein [Blastomonas sp.]